MHVSGFAETRHKMPSSDHPVRRPSVYSRQSPESIAIAASVIATRGFKTFAAEAAPAATKASAAGTGSPMASANTVMHKRRYP